MSEQNKPSPNEIARWERLRELVHRCLDDGVPQQSQFDRDLDAIIWTAIMETPAPFAPLRRMAQLVGIRELRKIYSLAAPISHHDFRLVIRERKLTERPADGARYKRTLGQMQAERFGFAVLRYEATGCSREEAMNFAASALRLRQSSVRSLQRLFQQFTMLMRERGFVGDHYPNSIFGPSFGLGALRAKVGRKKIATK